MPWKLGQTGGTHGRPPIISHARWNIRRSTVLCSPTNNHHDTPAQTIPHSSLEFQQCEMPKTTGLGLTAPPTQQLDLELQPNESTLKISPGFISYAPILTSSALPPTPQLMAVTGTGSMLMAILIYLFMVQQSSTTGPAAPLATPPAPRHQNSPRQHTTSVVKSQKSCYRWTGAIIQRRWDTAWDLTAHWNVESHRTGLGLPNIKWNISFNPLSLHGTSSAKGPCIQCHLTYFPV